MVHRLVAIFLLSLSAVFADDVKSKPDGGNLPKVLIIGDSKDGYLQLGGKVAEAIRAALKDSGATSTGASESSGN